MGDYKKKEVSFTIQAECANSGRQIEIALDSELNIKNVTHGSDPMFCLPIVTLANTREPSNLHTVKEIDQFGFYKILTLKNSAIRNDFLISNYLNL